MSKFGKISITEKNENLVWYSFYKENEDEEGNEENLEKLERYTKFIIENELSLERKSVVLLYYIAGLKQTEIALLLKKHRSTISRNLKRAKAQIYYRLEYFVK